MANFFTRLAQGAVEAAPYAAQVVARSDAREKAKLRDALAALHQQSVDNTAMLNANTTAGLGLANMRHLDAQTMKLQEPVQPKPTEFETLDTDQGFVRVPKVGTAGPITGPDGTPYKKRVTAPTPPHDQYTFPTVTNADGSQVVAKANTHTGEITPTDIGAKQSATGGRASAAITKAIANNAQQLGIIDQAIAEVKAHPESFGLGRGLPMVGGMLDQRLDPNGVRARSLISNIGSLQIHDRTGAAMSVHEEKRLAGFVPQASDTPEKIIENLTQLKASLGEYNNAMQHGGTPTDQQPAAPVGRGRGGPPPNVPHPQSADPGGNVNLGGDPEAAWAKTNPPKKGESYEQYHARYLKSQGGGDDE